MVIGRDIELVNDEYFNLFQSISIKIKCGYDGK